MQLRDGRILYLGVGKLDGERAIVAEESVDDGRSWNVIGTASPLKTLYVPVPDTLAHDTQQPLSKAPRNP